MKLFGLLCLFLLANACCPVNHPSESQEEVPENPKPAPEPMPERNRHPYDGVEWSTAVQINTTSHVHCEADKTLQVLQEHNFGFYTLSNYYPSAPTCPAGEVKSGRRGVPVTDYPLVVNGVLVDGPFDWNEILSAWKDSLAILSILPFKESSQKMFPSWVDGSLEAPNAEHFNFKGDARGRNMHMCCPGSAYGSGTFDSHDNFGTLRFGGYDPGCGLPWQTAIDKMLEAMIVPDGGGVTINHPGWTKLDKNFILQVLDYSPGVLGMEVLNKGDNDEDYWDWVLATGRQCFGFFVPDHGAEGTPITNLGVNVLVVPEATVEACLRAYRRGQFYGAAKGMGELKFTSISFQDGVLKASTDKPAKFDVITARGVIRVFNGTDMEYTLDEAKNKEDIYVRIKATAVDGCGEILFSQPNILI